MPRRRGSAGVPGRAGGQWCGQVVSLACGRLLADPGSTCALDPGGARGSDHRSSEYGTASMPSVRGQAAMRPCVESGSTTNSLSRLPLSRPPAHPPVFFSCVFVLVQAGLRLPPRPTAPPSVSGKTTGTTRRRTTILSAACGRSSPRTRRREGRPPRRRRPSEAGLACAWCVADGTVVGGLLPAAGLRV